MSWYSLGTMPSKTAILMGADKSSLCFIFNPSTLTSHSVTPFTIPWWFFSAGGLTTSITHLQVSPPQFRGQLVTWSETATNCGILLGFISGCVYVDVDVCVCARARVCRGATTFSHTHTRANAYMCTHTHTRGTKEGF